MASGNLASRAEVGASVDILMQKVYLGEDPGALVARYTDVVRPRGTSGTRSSKNATNDDETGGDLASGMASGDVASRHCLGPNTAVGQFCVDAAHLNIY